MTSHPNRSAIDLKALAEKVCRAIAAGNAAAAAALNDGGSANLDHVVLNLPRVRESSVAAAGIYAYKGRPGRFHFAMDFGGQGNRRYAGVRAMYDALKAEGVDCYIHYQMD